ncbi:CPBP family intramembrane metalloprotease [Mucilaginibacter mali]|uniref:CPBP family intramembrane metalloprotease n=1 Tax=Mucilaginibacter mali TaxID=2740462 RepID=A0A7D4TL05_9SPHI|nr:CPBP family glutamic-type intramembrane protease [Mucilaginibacter mali]QKJ29093.1 CPBP family intramembrane metalloprotease [Mucilaginibacter mali]
MLKEIFAIGNYPNLNSNARWDEKLLSVFKMYGIIVLAMIAFGPLWLLADKLVTDVFHHKSFASHYREVFQQMYQKLGLTTAIIFICIIGPLFEEVIFRLPLSFKRRQVFIAIAIAIFYLAGAFFKPRVLMLKIVIEIVLAILVLVTGFKFIPDTPLNISQKHRQQLVVLSVCVFGLMHISNYRPLDWPLIWLYPLFVIPQLLIGWGITYVRFKHGFVWGIALHCLVNSISTLLSLLVKH